MPRTPDMYWFAHGGIESSNSRHPVRSTTPGPGDTEDDSSENGSLPWKVNLERRAVSEEPISLKQPCDQPDAKESSPTNLIPKPNFSDKRHAVEERKRLLLEAEQEKCDAIMKKHVERGAAFEAKRNAQRSNIAFAFGSIVPRNQEADAAVRMQHSPEIEKPSRMPPTTLYTLPPKTDPSEVVEVLVSKPSYPYCCLSGSGVLIADNVMSQSMFSATGSARGRRKNDLTPTVPFDRTGPPRAAPPTRKRSVSMSRLDQLAQPRRAYVEAQKANSTISNSSSKDAHHSPTRPLSVASEKSIAANKAAQNNVTRRPPTATRKPRPISIAGTVPDHAPQPEKKIPGSNLHNRKAEVPVSNVKSHTSHLRHSRAKSSSAERPQKPATKPPEKPKTPTATAKANKSPTLKRSSKHSPPKQSATPKLTSTPKQWTPKTSPARKQLTNKKQAAMLVPAAVEGTANALGEVAMQPPSPVRSCTPDEDSQSADEKSSGKKIISAEEARAGLAEKRRLAREQAEREAELERHRQEELERAEEEKLRLEEEEHQKMAEEQLKLLDEHRKFEEEKLRKAIEEQERKEEEEKTKREEDARLKAELEKKAKEEADKQRVELEEKLRKEEGERAERKKRLEKIMSRTRGKSGTASPGSASGSEAPDSTESQPEILSGEPNSLDSNIAVDSLPMDNHPQMDEPSGSESYDYNQTMTLDSHSLSSNDLMIPSSGPTSLDASFSVVASEQPLVEAHQGLLRCENITHSDEGVAAESEGEEASSTTQPKTEVAVESSSDDCVPNACSKTVIEDSFSIDNQITLPSFEEDALLRCVDSGKEPTETTLDGGQLEESFISRTSEGIEQDDENNTNVLDKVLSINPVLETDRVETTLLEERATDSDLLERDENNHDVHDYSKVGDSNIHFDHGDNTNVAYPPSFEVNSDLEKESHPSVANALPSVVNPLANVKDENITSDDYLFEGTTEMLERNQHDDGKFDLSLSVGEEVRVDKESIQPFTADESVDIVMVKDDFQSAVVKPDDIVLLPKGEYDPFSANQFPMNSELSSKQNIVIEQSFDAPIVEELIAESSSVLAEVTEPLHADLKFGEHSIVGSENICDVPQYVSNVPIYHEQVLNPTFYDDHQDVLVSESGTSPFAEDQIDCFSSTQQLSEALLLPDPESDASELSQVLHLEDLPAPNVFSDKQTISEDSDFNINESNFTNVENTINFSQSTLAETAALVNPFANSLSPSNQTNQSSGVVGSGIGLERFADHGVLKTVDEMNFTNLEETNKNTGFLYTYEEEVPVDAMFDSQKLVGVKESTLDSEQSLHDQNIVYTDVNQSHETTDVDTRPFPVPEFGTADSKFKTFPMENSTDFSVLTNDGIEFNDSKTLNPFGNSENDETAFPVLSMVAKQVLCNNVEPDFGNELLMSALNSAIDESEDSSLDSNLSQVLNVDSDVSKSDEMNSFNSKLEVLNNGPSTADNTQTDIYDKGFSAPQMQHEDSFVLKTNGYNATYNNGCLYDDRFESAEFKADPIPVSPKELEKDHSISENGMNANISTVGNGNTLVDNVDNVNSNKMQSNPFLSTSAHQYSGNPFERT